MTRSSSNSCPRASVIEAAASTRADGSFEMAGLRPGKYALLVEAEGFAPYALGSWNASERIEIRAGAVAEVEIALPTTEAFLVDVLDEESGTPLDGARFEEGLEVERWTAYAPVPAPRRGDGAYELRSGYGEYGFELTWLRVSREGYAPRIVTFSGQKAGYRFRVALGRGGTIAGHIRASGVPVRGALVLVEWEMGGSIIASAITGSEGTFEIGALVAGDKLYVHVYDAAHDPIADVAVVLENGERRTLEIGGAGATAIEGRVVVDGAPAANASVRISGATDSDAATRRDGRYRVEGLHAGRHEVEVFADRAEFKRFVDLAEGQCLRLDIDASVVIPGVVVDADTGVPLTDVNSLEVFARREGSPGSDSVDLDREGRFRLCVEPGVYELDLPEEDEVYVIERPRVDVRAGNKSETVTVRVVRDRQDGRIVLDVQDSATGETVPEGDYECEFKRTMGWGSFEGGSVTEESLALGTHRYRIHTDAHAPTKVEITLTPERKVVRQTVVLRPANAVRITEIGQADPAALAGLRAGDVILACNGNATTSIAALRAALGEAHGAVSIEFERGGQRKTVTLPSGELDADLENILLGR